MDIGALVVGLSHNNNGCRAGGGLRKGRGREVVGVGDVLVKVELAAVVAVVLSLEVRVGAGVAVGLGTS